MATQLTAAEFLDVLGKSGLLPADRVQRFAEAETDDRSAAELAERMTATGLITKLQAHNLLAGRTQGYFVGPYKLLDKLGNGTSGQVYLAEHTRMKRRVALKVLQADKMRNPEAVKRFEREAKAAAALRHRNIVHAYDFARDEQMHYLVMEFVVGRNLLQVLTEDGRVGPIDAAKLMRQAADGLHFAHKGGVVHRDVKPSNLMVSAGGRLTILDLGLARLDGDDEELTRGGAILGVAAFIAPEQVKDSHAVDGRADLYGLGASFWLAVTGKKPPVYGKFDPPPPRTPFEENEYQQFLAVVRKCMALDPAARYQSAAALAEALTPLAGDRLITTPAPVATPAPVSASLPAPSSRPPGSRSSGAHSVLDDADDNDDCILSAPVPVKASSRMTVVNLTNANPVDAHSPPPVPKPPAPAPRPGAPVLAFGPPPTVDPLRPVLPPPMKQSNPFKFGDPNPPVRRSSQLVPYPPARPPARNRRWWVWAVVAVVGILLGIAAAFLTRG